jgi:hypothetical protein
VQLCWFRQARTEYSAASLTSEMCHWLMQLGVRPELLMRNSRLIGDEVRHSALCHELYLHAGGEPIPVPTERSRLVHADDPAADISLRALTAAGELACEESVAVAVFRARLDNARDAMAREVVEIILRDEANHRAFAWDLIDELIGLLGHAQARAWAEPRIAWWLRVYLRARLEDQVERYTPAQLGMGLLDRREHWALMKREVRDVVIPRFIERGLLDADATVDSLTARLQA